MKNNLLEKIIITIFAVVLFVALVLHFVFGWFNHWDKRDIIAIVVIDLCAIMLSYLLFKEKQ